MTDNPLKQRSRALTDGANRAGARAMLRAAGLKDEDFSKPLIIDTAVQVGLYMVRGPAATTRLQADPSAEPKLRYLAKGAVPGHCNERSPKATASTTTSSGSPA